MDCYLSASRADNCPVTIIESIASGVPVVSFATGGIPEIARHGLEGIIVEGRDPEALGAACSELLSDDPMRARIAHRARVRAMTSFRLDIVAERYREVYRQAMDSFDSRRATYAERLSGRQVLRAIMTSDFRRALSTAMLTPSSDV
jgi:glycosyltransferase involved in cell wall biosynthesis